MRAIICDGVDSALRFSGEWCSAPYSALNDFAQGEIQWSCCLSMFWSAFMIDIWSCGGTECYWRVLCDHIKSMKIYKRAIRCLQECYKLFTREL